MKKAAFVLGIAFAFIFLSCSGETSEENTSVLPEEKPVETTIATTEISISSAKTEIDAAGTVTLTANVTPANSTENVTWSITTGSDKATLSSTSGKSVTLTGKNATTSNASVTVKAASGSKSATKTITVKGKAVTPPAPATYRCPNCNTEYSTEAEKNNCAVKAGCPEFVTSPSATTYKCTNCNTEYSTEAEKNNCAVKAGCPEFVPESTDGLPDTSIAMAKAMTVGWNLGNTLDAHDTAAGKTNKGGVEIDWGMPTTTKAMIDAVAAKGFKTIRIPVSWHNHITADNGNYPVDSAWMARVKEIVDWAISNNMYVILNVHHDDLTRAEMNSMYGYCVDKDSTLQTKSKAYLTKVWSQIATTFAQYDNRLVFEVLNEPRYRDGENNGFAAPSDLSDYNAIIKAYEETCISTIRSAGGKNATRFLMVPAYAASPWNIAGWSIPTDSATNRLLVSTHAYDPYKFAMGDVNTFDDSIANELTGLFNQIKINFIDKNYGVVMGEASASDKNNTDDRKKWITDYFTKAKTAGIPVILWDNMIVYPNSDNKAERHGWFNRNNCTWYFEDLTNEMIKCAGGTPSENPPATEPTYTELWTGTAELDYARGDNNGVAISKDNIDSSAKGFRFTYTTTASDSHIRIMCQKDWTDRVITSATAGTLGKPVDSNNLTLLNLPKNQTNAVVTLYFSSGSMQEFSENGIKFYGTGAAVTKVELEK